MKKFLFALLLLWGGFASAANWLHDYEDALELAKKEQKMIMMMYVKKG